MVIKKVLWTTLLTVLHLCTCNDILKAAGETNKMSSRDYPSASGSSYYTTFAGYPSYPSTSAAGPDPFKPSDYGGGGGGSVYYNSLSSDNKKKPTYPPPYPTTYYPSAGALPECQDPVMGNVIGDILQTSGVPRVSILRSLVAAVTAAILTKIPIILAVKALMVKMFLLPLGFLVLSLPVLLPILLLFTPLWNRIREVFTGTSTTPHPVVYVMQPANATNATDTKGKSFGDADADEDDGDGDSVTAAVGHIFVAVVRSDRCLEKLACQLASRDSGSFFIKPVSWLLKFLQTFKFVQKNVEIRSALKRYRDAYLRAATVSSNSNSNSSRSNSSSTADFDDSDICSDDLYPCNIPALYSRPEFANYSRYL